MGNNDQKKESILDKLSPTARKYLYLGLAVVGLILFSVILSNDIKPKDKNNEIKNILTDKKNDDMGIESLLAQIKITNDNYRNLEHQIDKLSKENQLTRDEYQKNMTAINKVNKLERSYNKSTQTFETQLKALSERITSLTNDTNKLQKDINGESAGDNQAQSANKAKKPLPKRDPLSERVDLNDPYAVIANAPLMETPNLAADGANITSTLTTTIFSEDLSKKKKKLEEPEPEIYIPAGSMLRGVLLAGLDAPTGTNAKKDPFPVNVRIQKDAILPNGYSADLKECFMLMGGYGDLSSERALLRSETISCIKEDGSIIESKISGYASGEDGKAGIRGRLVSKTGSLIAKTMFAGFASGISSAFDVTMTPTINTSSTGTVTYEKVYNKEALRGAGAKGIAKAFDKLSDYYMKMADQMFPIIEVDGGRDVNIIVTSGANLKTVRDSEGKPVGAGRLDGDLPPDLVPPEPEEEVEPS